MTKKDYIDNVVKKIALHFNGDMFQNKTILVTGGTGLIGSTLIRYFCFLKEKKGININIFGTARNPNKVNSAFFSNSINWLYQDLVHFEIDFPVDYIIHTASPTDSSFFINNPVETINENIIGFNALIKRVNNNVKSIVYLSSMEVYGLCQEDIFLQENDFYSLNPMIVRNSYPETKRIIECLASSFASEYKIPLKVVRLCQTFGPGVEYTDNRVFAQFARAINENKDIVLSTKGETKRSYCSLTDACVGILVALVNGQNGEAYNIASDDSYYSIYEMANMFIKNTNSRVTICEKLNKQYLTTVKFGLDTTKIKKIGFVSVDTLQDMIDDLIGYFNAK